MSELQGSMGVYLMEELRRVTIGRILACAFFIIIGMIVGWALFGGGDVVIIDL